MKADNPPNNKIIPIHSLVENSRQQQKRYAYQSGPKDNFHLDETSNTPSHTSRKGKEYPCCNQIQLQIAQTRSGLKGQKVRGASIKKGFASMNLIPNNDFNLATSVKINYEFDEHHYPKTERTSRVESRNPIKEKNAMLENYKKQSIPINTPKSIQPDTEELPFMRQRFKSIALTRGPSEIQKYASIASEYAHKLDDQTWNASKFEKTISSSREMQPIYKSELIKIKTDLFQKQACLFQLSQKLEQKQTVIQDLTYKLQMANNRNTCQASEAARENVLLIIDKETKKLNQKVRQLEQEVVYYKEQLRKNKESFESEEERSETNKKLMILKLKQYEIEDREKSQYILQLRQRQKRSIENSEKITNAQQQLLRQKEEQLIKISQTAQLYKEQLEKLFQENQQRANTHVQSDTTRKIIIEELSSEMMQVKNNLHQLQIRMREMIQNEQELKRQQESYRQSIQILTSNNKNLQTKIEELKEQIIEKNKALELSKGKIDELSLRVTQLETDIIHKKCHIQELESLCSGKDFELSLMSKTCENYKKKIQQYHHFSQQMRVQIQGYQKREIVDKNSSISPKKQWSPAKDLKAQDRQIQLKQINLKLTKEIDRLNIIIKNLNISVYQFYKVNKGLNEVIIEHELCKLNSRFFYQMQADN